MRRAAVYARFSSEKQNEKSCDDQIALCRAWAERNGFEVVETYRDQAISGASTVGRLGLQRMLADAKARRFEHVICEALDRLSRDQADLATLKKNLAFIDIGISTTQDGEVGAMHIGLKGLMGELYLADLAAKTRRGLRARVSAGASGGGRSFGYRKAGPNPGDMEIIEEEAAIVRRIFAEYLDGKTPRQIAAGLNADGIASPRDGKWNASTINGSVIRQNGILQNRLYAGELIWNRQRFVKDPATGRRVSRPNPEADWIRAPVEHLRLIDEVTFQRANALKLSRRVVHLKGGRVNKPTHFLSGLTKCGCCGASFTIIYRDRLGCAGHRERGDCENTRQISRAEIEERVLAALESRMLDPENIAEMVRGYIEEMDRLRKEHRSQRSSIARLHEQKARQASKMLNMLTMRDEDPTEGEMREYKALALEVEELRKRLASVEEEAPKAVELHRGAIERYRRMVADLRHIVDEGVREEIFATLRRLIDRIEILPPASGEKRMRITVHGLLGDFFKPERTPENEGGSWLRGHATSTAPQIFGLKIAA